MPCQISRETRPAKRKMRARCLMIFKMLFRIPSRDPWRRSDGPGGESYLITERFPSEVRATDLLIPGIVAWRASFAGIPKRRQFRPPPIRRRDGGGRVSRPMWQ